MKTIIDMKAYKHNENLWGIEYIYKDGTTYLGTMTFPTEERANKHIKFSKENGCW